MILDNSFPPDPRVENEALTLIENGHQVFLFCFKLAKSKQKKQEIINGIEVHRHTISRLLYKLSALAYTVAFYHYSTYKSIIKFAEKNKIEALHVHDIQIARSVFIANKKLKLPIILDLHENRPEIMKFYSHVISPTGRLLINPKTWKRFEYKYIKLAQKVIVVTNEAREYYQNQIPVDGKKFHVVPNSIRKEFYLDYKTSNDIIEKFKDNFTLLYLGNTGLRRGLLEAINSLQFIIPEIPNIKLVIVGKSKTDHILKNRIAELGYEDYVFFAGWQSPDLFQSFILASQLGICPIHRNLHHDTTLANKLFQHLAFGKPLIVSNSTAQARLVKDYNCGLVFTDRNPQELANCIITLFQNKKLYNSFSKNGIAAIEKHLNWDIISKEIVQLYKEL